MAEYIERMVAIAEACKGCNEEFYDNPCEPPDCSLQRRLFAIPAADVVEVKHGKWIQTKEPLGANEVDCVECSACRESWIIEEDLSLEEYIEFWHYCPNCGADMRGETKCGRLIITR